MKKFLAIVLACMMLLSLVACGSKTEPTPAPEPAPSDSTTPEPAPADNTVYKLIVGSTVQDDSASGIAMIDYFVPYVTEKSGGRIEVSYQGNSVLGGDRDLYEALQMNTVQASFGPMSVLGNFEPNYAVCDLPFLFDSKEEAYAELDGEFGAKLAENLPSVGMRLLAYGENAFRNNSNSKRPITKYEDMNGLKIRIMESPVNIAMYNAWGANATPMAFSELYTGLQQKTVDGQDNGVVLTYTSKLYEVQDYYTFTMHQYAVNGMVFSEQFWQSLPADLQQVVADGSKYAMENQRRLNSELEEEYLKIMEDSGMKVSYMSDAERTRMKDVSIPVWGEFGKTIDPESFSSAVAIRDTDYKG